MKKLLMVSALVMASVLSSRMAWAQAQPTGPKNLGDNAALKYWLAFAMTPNLTEAEDDLVADWRGTTPDKAVIGIIPKCEAALRLLHEGAQYESCNWGLPKDGPETPMPYFAKARELARMACFRARYRVITGDGDGAVKDWLAACTLSRHCNADGTWISLMVRSAVQDLVTGRAAGLLKRLDRDQLGSLAAGLDALPQAYGTREAILSECEDDFGWWADRLKRDGARAAEEFLKALPQKAGAAKATAKEPVTAADVSSYIHDLETAQRYLALVAGMSELPPAEFEAQSQALAAKMGKDCAAVPVLLDLPLARFRYHEACSEAYMAMLKAAIAVVLDGPDRLKSFKDPFGEGPFEYSAVGTGFQLKSKLVFEGVPMELAVPGL